MGAGGERDAGTRENGAGRHRDRGNSQSGTRGASAAEDRQGSGF